MSTFQRVPSVYADVEQQAVTSFTDQPADPLADLYQREFARLVGLAHWVVGSRAVAEELVQETFVRLVENPPRLDDSAALEGYVRAALMNRSRSKLRRMAIERRLDRPSVQVGEDQRPDHQVREAVMALPIRQRQCVALRFYDDQTVPAIATTLGLSAGSVKTHLHRGLRSLSVALGESVPQEETR